MNRTVRTLGVAVCFTSALAVGPGAQTTALPEGWQSRDIGAVGQAGWSSHGGGTFTVSGAGADIWGTADAFHFPYRTVSGDVTVVARVSSVQGAQAWTKAGVMIRATTHASSAHALMLVSTSRGLAFQRRTASGGTSASTSGGAGTAPRWVKLARAGDAITASASADGRTWVVVGTAAVPMPSTVLVGLAVTSHDATRLATGTFDNVAVTTPRAAGPWANGRLRVSPGSHFFSHQTTGGHFFYLADTAWSIFRRLNREDADAYLRDCVAKGFTAIQAVALWDMVRANAYGDRPLGTTGGRFDPALILTTPGSDPADPVAYDYWDHVDYVIRKAEEYGLYVVLEPTWGNYVSGVTSYAFDMSSNIFTVENARPYGEFIGRRYGPRPNIIWMLGGDRSAVYPNGDFRGVWRSMAEGVGRGVSGQPLVWNESHAGWEQVLMTYQATRRDDPGSSRWFHTDPWLDFNGVQAEYHNITTRLRADWNRLTIKPTALVEPRYEDELSTDRIVFTGGFKQRYQLYHALFSGAAGYAYGHKSIWDFVTTTDKTWQIALNDPGRVAMRFARQLLQGFSTTELLNRVPDHALLDGELGTAKTEDLLVAMRGGTGRFALVYSTNGRDIRLNPARLASGTADAFWFNPRTGGVTAAGPFATGGGTPITVFNPPGMPATDNDWVLEILVR